MSKMDYQAWMTQPRMLNERCRGLPLIWTPDVNWFNNDWLGPTPHVHDDATEIGFLAQGSLEIQVGSSKRVYHQGDFIMMPPGKYHNYWFKGSDPACFFVTVAPNHKYKRLRDRDFTPDAFEGEAPYANVYTSDTLPSNEHFQCEKVTLQPGEYSPEATLDLKDRVIYIISGSAQIRSHALSGGLAANQYLHIPATTPHQMRNVGFEPLIYLALTITDPFTAHGTVIEPEE